MIEALIARIGGKIVVTIIGGVMLVLLLWAVVHFWTAAHTAGAKADLATKQGQAATENGKDAIEATGGVSDRSGASEDLTRRNAVEIGKAKGAVTSVDPDVNAAGHAALCRRNAYKDTPQCKKP